MARERNSPAEPDGHFGAMWPRDPGAPLPLPFTVRFRRLYVRARPEPQIVPPHLHDDLELVLPIAGTWQGTICGETIAVPAGGALVVAPGDRHEDRCREPLALYGISLDLQPGSHPGWSASPLAAGCPIALRCLPHADSLHLRARQLEQLTTHLDRWTTLRQDALALELVVELLALLPEKALAPELAARIASTGFAAAVAAVLAADSARLTVSALAQALGMAERTLQQRCRMLLGSSPLALIRRHRLDLARALLGTGASVQAVAEQTGFANPFHFSTAYRQCFGHPPSATMRESEGRQLPRTWPPEKDSPSSEG